MRQRKVLAGAARAQHPPSAGGPIVRIRGGATAPEEVPLNGGAERLLNAFREWLLHPGHGRVRGISEKTSKLYLPVARRYVAWYMYAKHDSSGPGPDESVWPRVMVGKSLMDEFQRAHLLVDESGERHHLMLGLSNYGKFSAALRHLSAFLWLLDGNASRGDLVPDAVPDDAREDGAGRLNYHVAQEDSAWCEAIADPHVAKNKGKTGVFTQGEAALGKKRLHAQKAAKRRDAIREGNVDYFQKGKAGAVPWNEMDSFLRGVVQGVVGPSGSSARGAWRDTVRKDARLHTHLCCTLHLNGRPIDGFNRRLAEFWASPYQGGLNPYERIEAGTTTYRLMCSEHKMSSRTHEHIIKESIRHRVAHWCFAGSLARAHFVRWHGPEADPDPDIMDLKEWIQLTLYPAVPGAPGERAGDSDSFATRTARMLSNTDSWLEATRIDANLSRWTNWTDKSMHLRRISNNYQIAQGDADIVALAYHGGWEVPFYNKVHVTHYAKEQPPSILAATAGCMYDPAAYHTQFARESLPVPSALIRLYCPWKDCAEEALRPELDQARRQRVTTGGDNGMHVPVDIPLTTTRNRFEVVKAMRALAEVFWQDSAVIAAETYGDTSEMEGSARVRSHFFDLKPFRSPSDPDLLVQEFKVLVRSAMLRMTSPGERAKFSWFRRHAEKHGDEPSFVLAGPRRGERETGPPPVIASRLAEDQLAAVAQLVATEVVATIARAVLTPTRADPSQPEPRQTEQRAEQPNKEISLFQPNKALQQAKTLKDFYEAWLAIDRAPTKRKAGGGDTDTREDSALRKRIRDTRCRYRERGMFVLEILNEARSWSTIPGGEIPWVRLERAIVSVATPAIVAAQETPGPRPRVDIRAALKWASASGNARASLGRSLPGAGVSPAPENRSAMLDAIREAFEEDS